MVTGRGCAVGGGARRHGEGGVLALSEIGLQLVPGPTAWDGNETAI